jgi:hypothetical protein
VLAPSDDAPHRPRTVRVDHRAHGALTADAAEPAGNGYLLTVACSRGVLFAPEDAEFDLTPRGIAELSFRNHKPSSG